ncbi:hypothetical protein Ddc_14217 [Ditylenchus destructor]|nr:hypothetical protein Ddc_14217 [Ditylenchus destructor]
MPTTDEQGNKNIMTWVPKVGTSGPTPVDVTDDAGATLESTRMGDAHRRKMNTNPTPQPLSDHQFVNVDKVLEELAFEHFESQKKSKSDWFHGLKRNNAKFTIDQTQLTVEHGEQKYENFPKTKQTTTIFNSMSTNNSTFEQKYSSNHRLEKFFSKVTKSQGFAFNSKPNVPHKTQCKVGEEEFKIPFNLLPENMQFEKITWNTGNNTRVPAGEQIKIRVDVDEIIYSGRYTLVSTLTGEVTVVIKSGEEEVDRVTLDVAIAFQQYLDKSDHRLEEVVTVKSGKVEFISKGTFHIEHILERRVYINDTPIVLGPTVTTGGSVEGSATTYPLAPTGMTATTSRMNRMNLPGYNPRPSYAGTERPYADVARVPNYRAATRYLPPIQNNPTRGIPFHQRARAVTRAPENLRPTVHRPAAESTSSHESQRQEAYTSHEILQQLHSRSQQ